MLKSIISKTFYTYSEYIPNKFNYNDDNNCKYSNIIRGLTNNDCKLITDTYINGECFLSKPNNKYFCIVDKNIKINELTRLNLEFNPINRILKSHYDSEKHIILRLEFTKNKIYFVESYQAISTYNPDVTIMNMDLNELIAITPSFEPL